MLLLAGSSCTLAAFVLERVFALWDLSWFGPVDRARVRWGILSSGAGARRGCWLTCQGPAVSPSGGLKIATRVLADYCSWNYCSLLWSETRHGVAWLSQKTAGGLSLQTRRESDPGFFGEVRGLRSLTSGVFEGHVCACVCVCVCVCGSRLGCVFVFLTLLTGHALVRCGFLGLAGIFREHAELWWIGGLI